MAPVTIAPQPSAYGRLTEMWKLAMQCPLADASVFNVGASEHTHPQHAIPAEDL